MIKCLHRLDNHLTALLILVLLSVKFSAYAEDGDYFLYDNIYYKVLSEVEKTVAVSDNQQSTEEVINIPPYVMDYSVIAIEDNAFFECYSTK